MNRQIKFRAWEINKKRMIDLHRMTPLCTTIENHDGLYIPFVDNIILMQYTGLKDKNGKDLYDGDIVRYKRDDNSSNTGLETNHRIFFGNGGFMVEFDVFPIGKGGLDLRIYNEKIEVIGNIYENKELLDES